MPGVDTAPEDVGVPADAVLPSTLRALPDFSQNFLYFEHPGQKEPAFFVDEHPFPERNEARQEKEQVPRTHLFEAGGPRGAVAEVPVRQVLEVGIPVRVHALEAIRQVLSKTSEPSVYKASGGDPARRRPG